MTLPPSAARPNVTLAIPTSPGRHQPSEATSPPPSRLAKMVNGSPALGRTGSFSGAQPLSPQANKLQRSGSIIDLFRSLSFSAKSSQNTPPLSPPSPEPVTKANSTAHVTFTKLKEESRSPRLILSEHLASLFRDCTLKVTQDAVTITLATATKNCDRGSVVCLSDSMLRPLLKNSKGVHRSFAVVVPLEALESGSEYLLHHFLVEAAPHLTSLTCFPTAHCKQFSGSNKWHFPALNYLDLSRCNVNAEALKSIVCPEIETIKLRKVKHLDISELLRLPNELPKLKEVDFSKCPQVTSEEVKKVYDVDPSSLLFFLKMAVQYANKELEELLRTKMKELYGKSVSVDKIRGSLALRVDSNTVDLKKFEKLFLRPSDVYVRLIVRENKLDTINKFTSWLEEKKISYAVVIRTSPADIKKDYSSIVKELEFRSKSHITQDLLREVQHYELLDLSQCKIETLNDLASRNLQVLNLAESTLVDEASFCHALNHLKRLRIISLNGCKWVTSKMIFDLWDQCPELTLVDVRNCPNLAAHLQTMLTKDMVYSNQVIVDFRALGSTEEIRALAIRAIGARSVVLKNCEKFTGKASMTLFSKLTTSQSSTSLKSVTLENFVSTNVEVFQNLKTWLPNLQKLKLIGPVGFSAAVQLLQLADLKKIHLAADEERLVSEREALFNDESLKLLGEELPYLEKVTLENFSDVTLTGMAFLILQCKMMKELRLKDCPRVDRERLEALCASQQIQLEHTASPYRLSLRPTTPDDFGQALKFIHQQRENFKTILEESPVSNPEAIMGYQKDIDRLETQIKLVKGDIEVLTEAFNKEYKLFIENVSKAPVAPEGQKDLRNSRLLHLNQSSEKLTKCSADLLAKKKHLEELEQELNAISPQYEQGLDIIKNTEKALASWHEEERLIFTRKFALTCKAQNRKALNSLESMLANIPLCKRLLEQILMKEGKLVPFTFTILQSEEEIAKLVEMGLLKAWAPNPELAAIKPIDET